MSTRPSKQPHKAAIPSPLPRHRGDLSLPASLTTNIQTALMGSDRAIPRIQNGMATALTQPYRNQSKSSVTGSEEGWIGALGVWLAREFEKAEQSGQQVSDDEILGKVLDGVRATRDADGELEQVEGPSDAAVLKVPDQAVAEMVVAVRKELEKCCVVVDGDEWVG